MNEGLFNLISITLIVILIVISVGYFVWGVIQYLSSGGDKAGLEAARGRISRASGSFILVLFSTIVLSVVNDVLSVFGILVPEGLYGVVIGTTAVIIAMSLIISVLYVVNLLQVRLQERRTRQAIEQIRAARRANVDVQLKDKAGDKGIANSE